MKKKLLSQAGALLAAAIVAGCGGGGDSTPVASSGAAPGGAAATAPTPTGGTAPVGAGGTDTAPGGAATGSTGAGAGSAGSGSATTGFATQQTQQVNTTTAGDQSSPAVAALAGGGYVVVWSSGDVRAQIYDAQDQKVGAELTVFHSGPQGAQVGGKPAVAGLPDGSFIVTVGASTFTVGNPPQWSFYAQRVDANGQLIATGTPSSADFNAGLSSVVTTQDNRDVLIGIDSGPIFVRGDGSYSISYWLVPRPIPQSSETGVVQNYDAAGRPVGPPAINTITTLTTSHVDTAAQFPGGNFLVASERGGPANGVSWTITTMTGQQVAQTDMPSGPLVGSFDSHPHVAILSDGAAVLVWQRRVDSPSSSTWLALRINADGSAVGDPVTLALPQDVDVTITSLPHGGFLATWTSSASGPLLARLFDNTLAASTDVFQLAAQISSTQYAISPVTGGFVTSFAAPGTQGQDIFAERFVATH